MRFLSILITLFFLSMAFAGCIDESEGISPGEVKDFFELSSAQRSFLDEHSFAAVEHGTYTNFPTAYEMLHDEHIPIFVTTDSVLHLYHINFDNTLKDIEEHFLYFSTLNLTHSMLNASEQDYHNLDGGLKELAKRNVAFFSVAASLLETEFEAPDYVKEMVNEETGRIESHSGFHECLIMPSGGHFEDYSQYIPRGHYTKSELLKRYFKGMMWYGRMAFYLKDENETRMAVMNTLNLHEHAAEDWEALYNITCFYVGAADDLTYQDYLRGITEVYGSLSADYHELENSTKLQEFRDIVKTYRKPKIVSTLVWDHMNATEETMGFRVMGQRFIPDSYMFQQLVYDKVSDYLGEGEPFTYVEVDIDSRGFPRGLDVFAVLGSDRAYEILEREGDTEYVNYTEQYTRLKNEFVNYNSTVWEQNLYWRWLDGLRMLTEDFNQEGYPNFMRDTAWRSEKLNTDLGSWTELRHDTILYAKQSYTAKCGATPKYEERGYVEPVPEFYSHLLNLTITTREGLEERGYLTEKMKNNLTEMGYLLEKLKGISGKELQGKGLSDPEYTFIREIYEHMGSYKDKVPLVADVHTETNTEMVLEEATGYLDFVLVKVKIKGDTTICAGPIFSHYEFKHPMDDRLTDEKWRDMLENGEAPARAPWVKDYMP